MRQVQGQVQGPWVAHCLQLWGRSSPILSGSAAWTLQRQPMHSQACGLVVSYQAIPTILCPNVLCLRTDCLALHCLLAPIRSDSVHSLRFVRLTCHCHRCLPLLAAAARAAPSQRRSRLRFQRYSIDFHPCCCGSRLHHQAQTACTAQQRTEACWAQHALHPSSPARSVSGQHLDPCAISLLPRGSFVGMVRYCLQAHRWVWPSSPLRSPEFAAVASTTVLIASWGTIAACSQHD